MTPRERVLFSINHKEPDRVPIDLGSLSVSTMNRATLVSLQLFLGGCRTQSGTSNIMQKRFQNVDVPEELLLKFGIDLRGIRPGKARNRHDIVFSDGRFIDEWGITYAPSAGGAYYDIVGCPLAEVEIDEIESHLQIDADDPGYTDGIRKRAEYLYHHTNYALVGNMTSAQIFERSWYLRGFERFLMDLSIDRQYAHKLLRILTDIQKERVKNFLAEVGGYLQIFKVSDDLSGQLSPLISPQMYREMIQPYHREYFAHIKKHTNAKLALHSCGNFRPLLRDFIEAGVDIIHSVQQSCIDMEPEGLKKEFGSDIVFWGGMDVQNLLPEASVQEVKDRVRRLIDVMGQDGGYIFGPSHNIQADVPPQNIVTMYEAVLSASLRGESSSETSDQPR
jgi:uroporphyrinogen decarboxylase